MVVILCDEEDESIDIGCIWESTCEVVWELSASKKEEVCRVTRTCFEYGERNLPAMCSSLYIRVVLAVVAEPGVSLLLAFLLIVRL